MTFEFKTKGVCSRMIHFDLDGTIVRNVEFTGGCNGNLQGIGALVEGMEADEAIRRLQGIRCGFKETSCPDQLSQALAAACAKLAEKKSS
ncbi:TIGR03905 family TSCPD domain-containing protein [Candidatus Avoscillospira sp. LCP25S3_F1]|uniref:TIGR03905 family TSCPD domain-containing protein n=1 Tax=Candidatus Avoscillospira sp. LCP25S3_F1 TaxID=3438825 RepID=UPI003F900848